MKHVISINGLSRQEIDQVVNGSADIIGRRKSELFSYDPSKKIIFAFFEPSTRTKGSYIEAARKLGWDRDVISGSEATSLMKKESLANTARMLALQGADILVMRTKIEGTQKFVAELLEEENYNVAVHNGGDGSNQHPTQTFLDLLTIQQTLKRLDNFKIGFFGDLKYGRTVHSLLCALAQRENISVMLVSDPETALQQQYINLFPRVEKSDSLEALAGCDVIYGSRLQKERFGEDVLALQRAAKKFQMNQAIMDLLKPNAIVMHPLPYVDEIAPEIRRDPRIVFDKQAWYGIPTRYFLLNQSYKEKDKKELSAQRAEAEIETIKEQDLARYFANRRQGSKSYAYFMPIKNGTVIDHIPLSLGLKIREMLKTDGLLTNGVKHLIEDVPSGKMDKKDVLVLEDIHLPEKTMIGIASLAPTITFNLVEKTIKKIKIKTPPIMVGLGKCPNVNCITNRDGEARPKFVSSETTHDITCYYCEKTFKPAEII